MLPLDKPDYRLVDGLERQEQCDNNRDVFSRLPKEPRGPASRLPT
jgi:hypothetical protein